MDLLECLAAEVPVERLTADLDHAHLVVYITRQFGSAQTDQALAHSA